MALNSKKLIILTGFLVLAVCWAAPAQERQKPLTNADVIRMVKAKVPESVVISAIQAGPAKFTISPDALIKLHDAGVTEQEMNAIMAASNSSGSGAPAQQAVPNSAATQTQGIPPSSETPGATAPSASAPPPAQTPSPAPATSAPGWQMPTVSVLQNGATQELPLEKTQLAQTNTKPESMSALAGDTALTQAIQVGVSDAAATTASHMSSGIGGSVVQQAGGIFSGMLARRQPTVTYVWGVPNPASSNVLQTSTPKFSVNFANTPGVEPSAFAPKIVKLTPAQNMCRLVGATQGKEDARSHDAADWKVYSSFLEDRVPVNLQKIKTGEYQISPESALLPGEYAVVLRPISKSKRFSGGDVARAQGDGLMFDAVWSFQVPPDSKPQ
jgi:hypothetical protein